MASELSLENDPTACPSPSSASLRYRAASLAGSLDLVRTARRSAETAARVLATKSKFTASWMMLPERVTHLELEDLMVFV